MQQSVRREPLLRAEATWLQVIVRCVLPVSLCEFLLSLESVYIVSDISLAAKDTGML